MKKFDKFILFCGFAITALTATILSFNMGSSNSEFLVRLLLVPIFLLSLISSVGMKRNLGKTNLSEEKGVALTNEQEISIKDNKPVIQKNSLDRPNQSPIEKA